MTLPVDAPRGGRTASWLGGLVLKLSGWRVTGELPGSPRRVLTAAPHTSNWDFVYLLAVAFKLRARIRWLGKASLFRVPFGMVMRRLGGIAVDRARAGNLVQLLADRFARSPHLTMVIPSTGTRGQTEYWKSGFYRVAKEARATVACGFLDYPSRTIVIPPTGPRGRTEYWKSGFYWVAKEARATVVCGFLDYPSRTAGLGHAFVPRGNVSEDMQGIRGFYRGIRGKYPQRAREPRLEDQGR